MKKILLIITIILTSATAFCQVKKPATIQKAEGAPNSETEVTLKFRYDPPPIENTIGQLYIVQPYLARLPNYFFLKKKNKEGELEHVGRQFGGSVLKLVSLSDNIGQLVDSAGVTYEADIDERKEFRDLTLKSELDTLRKLFVDKIVYLKWPRLTTPDLHDQIVGGQVIDRIHQISDSKYKMSPVKITSVMLNTGDLNPFKLMLLTPDNVVGMYGFDFRTDRDYTEIDGRDSRRRLSDEFYGVNILKKFKLTPLQITYVKKQINWVGMSDKLFEALYGEPDKVNESNYGSTHEEQWVYDGGLNKGYYYFTNGKYKASN